MLWRLQFAWRRTNLGPILGVGYFLAVVAVLLGALQAAYAYRDEQRRRSRDFREQSIACLARNVYYEARGEPISGQYAVAEVTMNRLAVRPFPRTTCAVVYEPSAFSWTIEKGLAEPAGPQWAQAQLVAENVYSGKHAPIMRGALYYHAVYVKPAWAAEKRRLGRIGQHVFYR